MRHTAGRPCPRRIIEFLQKILHGILTAAVLGYADRLSKTRFNDINVQEMPSLSSYRIETLYYLESVPGNSE